MALAFGPLIGGFISQHLHWGWIFFINVPVGIIALAIAAVTMDESRDMTAARSLDLPGMVTSSVALLELTYALIEGHDRGWTSARHPRRIHARRGGCGGVRGRRIADPPTRWSR